MAGAVALAVAVFGLTGAPTVTVAGEEQFQAAVAALRDSGGTIALQSGSYRELVVGERASRPLHIVGKGGVRVGHVLFDHTQRVSLGRLTIAPLGGDASIEVKDSEHVDLHDLVVTAQGTRYSASVVVPDSRYVTVRRSEFTHCGDRSPSWVICLQPQRWSQHLVVEDNRFHDCFGCDFVHGRFGFDLSIRRNRFERAVPCSMGPVRCGHQDLIEMFAGQRLRVEGNHFGVYKLGGAQLYLTDAIDHVVIVNNVFSGTDPRVPGYRSRIGLVIGARGSSRLPHDVRVVNNTILTGARRVDGYAGSIRISSRYAALPRAQRPLFANNVIGLLTSGWPVCEAAGASISNVVVRGVGCSSSDRVGRAGLAFGGRPTGASQLLIGRADRRYAPARDITGRSRAAAPDIGAYEYFPPG
jgi:parallel beta helix pectate lyase-like protein